MAIDVKAEAEKIAESFVRIRTTGTTIEGAAAVHAAEVEICGSNIIDLVTRAVAEAKREQMAIVLAEITRLRDQYPTDVFGDGTAPDASLDSKSAFMARRTCDNLEREIKAAINDAATQPRDIGREIVTDLTAMCKEQARQRLDKAAVELARMTKCIEPSESMVVNNNPDPGCECPACVLMIAACELGIDGAA